MPAPLIPEDQNRRPGDTITVTQAELERTFAVWLITAPSRIFEPYRKMLAMDRTRITEADRADPRTILAAYLAEKFEQAKWTATRIEPEKPRSPLSWRGD